MIKSFITKTRWLVTIILLTSLAVGHVLATDHTSTFSNTDALTGNTITKNSATWSIGTIVGKGSPSVSFVSQKYSGTTNTAIKFGSSKDHYYSTITFTTDYFKDWDVSAVAVKFALNGGVSTTLEATLGETTIGSASYSTGQTWNTKTMNATTGHGGRLIITINTTQAILINQIKVTYTNTAHTITFNAGSGTCGTASSGSIVSYTLPTATPPASCATDGWGFYGWATSSQGTETETAPAIVGKAGDTYRPAANVTLYAVYAKGEYTKETSAITSGSKYLIVGKSGGNNYIMKSEFLNFYNGIGGDWGMPSAQINETSSGKYSAAAVNAKWCYTIEGTAGNYYIRDVVHDEDENYLDIGYQYFWNQEEDDGDKYTITVSAGVWTIKNNFGSLYFAFNTTNSNNAFITANSAQNIYLYKETSTPKYHSSPSCAASCDAPTSPVKGSVNASSQTVSWTAPASAPANGYLVAYSTATSDNPADNIYSTSGNYTVMAISAGTTTANIPCNSAGTYNWWVRSKCSADNSSLSSWVKGTAFTMKQIYLQVNDNWANDNANFCAYYWNADPKTGFTKIMTEQADCEEKIYTCVFPTDYSNMKFVRLDPVQVDPVVNFDNRWNETGNLTLAADKNYYQITGGTGSSVTGSWTTYAQKVKVSFNKNTTADGVTNPSYQCVVVTSGRATAPTIGDMSHDRLGYQLSGWKDGGTTWNFSTMGFAADKTLDAYWTAGATTPIALKTTWSDQDWRTGNCIVYAHCYIDGTNQFEDILMTGNVCDEYLVADAPYGTTHISFARCKAGTSLPLGTWESNDNVYNYVTGQEIGGTNTYEITGWGSGKVGTATKAGSAYVAPTYTVSFDKGTGTGGSTASHTGIICDASQTIRANGFTKDHYHFTGWTSNVSVTVGGESTTSVGAGATITNITQNITLTAQWAPDEYTVTATMTNVSANLAFPISFTYTGSATTALDRTLSAATGYQLPASITVTMGGSTLTKGTHYTYDSSTGAFAFTATITGNIVITVSGVAKTYGNTLEREGGTTGSTSVTTTYNSSTLTGYTAPTKTGYTFGGYWSGDDGTGTEVIGTNGALKASVTVSAVAWTNSSSQWVKDGAVTMYAKWTAKNYTVTLNDGSGSGGSGSKSVTYNSNTNLTTNVAVPTYAGNDFRGYYTSTGGGGTKVIDGNGAWIRGTSYVDASGNWVYDGSPTLHAYYTTYAYENYRTSCADQYNIVLDDGLVATTNNGSAKVADNGTSLTSIVAPTKSGYDIEGYYTTSGLATKIATPTGALSASITVSGDAWTDGNSKWVLGTGATFYTKWSAHTYTITYEGLEGASNTNPTSYNIETTTFALANPGARTGYTFSGWTLGGSPITSITIGSTGDKTITATWSINTPNLAVSAADHVVITATPASELAIAEGANRNVNYNKTVTLNCTPDAHWNIAWDVYKTGETATKVAVSGSGDGATFTMPDYAVTVAAVMTEDTYHTATFKNNGEVIDGYDEVKTYDGERPSAPTLTDITDACDKTDCNKFYGWIAEADIWDRTINSVAGKTIYRNASSIPVVSGADVVYHAVWAKGTGVSIEPTLIAKWDKQALTASSAVKAKDKDGNTLNDVTMTMSNVSLSSSTGVYGYSNNSISGYPVITISGLDFSSYDGGTITFFARASTSGGELTAEYSTDNGVSFSDLSWSDYTAKTEYGYLISVSSSTTDVRISYSSNSGNFYFGTVRVYGDTDTDYDFTELTSSNTSGWSGADWDGYYLISTYYESESKYVALRSDVMEGRYGLSNVTPSTGVISTDDVGLIFKVTYNSSTSKYAIQSVATLDYLSDDDGGVDEKFHLLETSETGNDAITYNDITLTTGYYLRWNSSTKDRFGSYTSGTNPTLYKALDSYTEFRITCCDKTVTIGTPTKTGTGTGTVTFASGGDAYAAGDEVETCAGATTITATVTPGLGHQCTALSFTRSDAAALTPDPAISVPFTGAQNYDLTFEQNADGVTLNTTVTFVALIDHYIDNMHYNTTQNKSGNYGTAPTLSDETKGEQCTGLHYKFVGWIPETDMNMTTGVPTTTANMVAGGATGKYATGTNYYAIWAEEE